MIYIYIYIIYIQKQIGLYRDDDIAAVQASGPTIDRLRKRVISLFKEIGLSISVSVNMKRTDFLDIFLDLETGSYQPYRKPNETPVYININSNHPRSIKKQLPDMISDRISKLSSSKEIFTKESQLYETSLQSAGYFKPFQFKPKENKKAQKLEEGIYCGLILHTVRSWRQM